MIEMSILMPWSLLVTILGINLFRQALSSLFMGFTLRALLKLTSFLAILVLKLLLQRCLLKALS